jgi:hypothetical protein
VRRWKCPCRSRKRLESRHRSSGSRFDCGRSSRRKPPVPLVTCKSSWFSLKPATPQALARPDRGAALRLRRASEPGSLLMSIWQGCAAARSRIGVPIGRSGTRGSASLTTCLASAPTILQPVRQPRQTGAGQMPVPISFWAATQASLSAPIPLGIGNDSLPHKPFQAVTAGSARTAAAWAKRSGSVAR